MGQRRWAETECFIHSIQAVVPARCLLADTFLLVLLLLVPTAGVRVCACHAVHNGHIKRITDEEIQSSVLEIMSSNVSTTFITCPADPQKTLGIKLPFLVMIVKVSQARAWSA